MVGSPPRRRDADSVVVLGENKCKRKTFFRSYDGITALIDDRRQPLGHGVAHPLDSVVAIGLVGAGRDNVITVQLVHSERNFGA